MGLTKLLLKKFLDVKEDFQEALSYLNNTGSQDNFSPLELFYRRKPRSFIPDIIQDVIVDIKERMKSRDKNYVAIRSNLRHTKDKARFAHGGYVKYQDQVGPTKGMAKTCKVLEVREHGCSFWVKFLTNKLYLRPWTISK